MFHVLQFAFISVLPAAAESYLCTTFFCWISQKIRTLQYTIKLGNNGASRSFCFLFPPFCLCLSDTDRKQPTDQFLILLYRILFLFSSFAQIFCLFPVLLKNALHFSPLLLWTSLTMFKDYIYHKRVNTSQEGFHQISLLFAPTPLPAVETSN